jgi:uncharacterized protein
MGDGGAADDGSSPPAAAGFSYLAVFHNYPLVAALLGFAIAQSIKFFVTWYVPWRLFSSLPYLGTPGGCLAAESGAGVIGSASSSDGQSCRLLALFACSVYWRAERNRSIPPKKKNLCLELEEW